MSERTLDEKEKGKDMVEVVVVVAEAAAEVTGWREIQRRILDI